MLVTRNDQAIVQAILVVVRQFWGNVKTFPNAALPELEYKRLAETELKYVAADTKSHDHSYLAKWKSDPCKVGVRNPSGVQAVMA